MKFDSAKLVGSDMNLRLPSSEGSLPVPIPGMMSVHNSAVYRVKQNWNSLPISGSLGPTELIGGNEILGFLGEVSTDEVLSGDELATYFGVTQGVSVESNIGWFKFYHQSRTLFVAKRPIYHSISWAHLYQKGLVYASGTGPNPYGELTDQSATIQIAGATFAVRLLQGATSNWSTQPGREWNDLIYPITNGTWASYSTTDINAGTSANGAATWVQETTKRSDYRAIRGHQTIQTIWESSPVTFATSAYGWRPVLELIE